MSGSGPGAGAASVPTFQLSDQDQEERRPTQSQPSANNLLSVPTQIKSSIGVNNPLNKSAGQFPLLGSQQVAGAGSATGNPRNKVGLAKGFGLMDWIRLSKSGKDLTGVGGPFVNGKPREITKQELKKHRKRNDAWMAINGAVYNVTQYMDYHPGGWDELVRGAGRDATDMFNEIHKWVNYQSLLEACLVGKLVDGPAPAPALLSPPPPAAAPPKLLPPVLPPIPSKPPTPTMDYFQTDNKITINIYTKRKGLTKDNVIVDLDAGVVRVQTYLPHHQLFLIHLQLAEAVRAQAATVRVGATSGKIEVDLAKESGQRWRTLGTPLDRHLWCGDRKDVPVTYRPWTVSATRHVTHNTIHLVLTPPATCHQHVSPGHHVQLRAVIEDTEIVRSYTPVTQLTPGSGLAGAGLQFLVKIYPETGALTPHLASLRPGAEVSVSDTLLSGTFSATQLPDSADSLVTLLAAGTGLTPMIPILASLQSRKQRPRLRLITFDTNVRDIIWKDELATFQSNNRDWASVTHVVTSPAPGEDWAGDTGRVTEALLRRQGEAAARRWWGVCGPPGFNREAGRLLRESLGVSAGDMHVFEG